MTLFPPLSPLFLRVFHQSINGEDVKKEEEENKKTIGGWYKD
jgi:hypothetical protein